MLFGMILLLIMIGIGLYKTRKRIKAQDEFFFFSVMKWTLAGWASLGICGFITVCKEGNGDKKALFLVSLFFILGTTICAIVEKIVIGNNLRKKKIEEYNNDKKNSWK